MLVSFVVRLVVDDLHAGAIAGEVHNVVTGEQAIVRSFDELIEVFAHGADAFRSTPHADLGENMP
jgi:uncharacterized membrane protein